MKPYTRELISDRRQPTLRWSAVFAGATIAVALWVLLQMLGMGIGFVAIDVSDEGSLRSVGIGTTVWTMIAPLIALFVGGWIAGRLSTTFDQRLGAMHGFVVGALASLSGIAATMSMVTMLAGEAMPMAHGHYMHGRFMPAEPIDPSVRAAEMQQASEGAGKVLLGAGISLLLGLGAAIGGGALAVRRLARSAKPTEEAPVVPPPVPPPPPVAPRSGPPPGVPSV